MAKSFTFRVPRRTPKRSQTLILSDRASTLPLLFDIRKEAPSTQDLPHPNVLRVLEKFKRPQNLLLYIPRNLQPDPFTYYCTGNMSDLTIVTNPRLSVTKLLTGAWCELEMFYRIYAGMPQKETTANMAGGTEYHDKLEDEEHERADMSSAEAQLAEIAEGHSPEDTAYLGRNAEVALWAYSVTEHGIKRLMSLAQKGHAREVSVHNFIDMETCKFVEHPEDLHKGVLVRGIADIVQFERKDAPKNVDLTDQIEPGSEGTRLENIRLYAPLWDLNMAIPEAKEEVQKNRGEYYLQVRDVKTRNRRTLPVAKLQLKAAKDQCLYYTLFLLSFTKNLGWSYALHEGNARRHTTDIDASIGEAHAAILLLKNFEALAMDFVRLATGQPMGYNAHDAIMKEKYNDTDTESTNYNLSRFILQEVFDELLEKVYGDSLALKSIDTSVLFRPWKYPLTARYFIGRISQINDIFEGYEASTVAVDYHHRDLGTLIGSKVYPYSGKVINDAMRDAVEFWTGRRQPREADVKFKCNNCDFNSRCPAVNKPFKQSIGELIYHDLAQ